MSVKKGLLTAVVFAAGIYAASLTGSGAQIRGVINTLAENGKQMAEEIGLTLGLKSFPEDASDNKVQTLPATPEGLCPDVSLPPFPEGFEIDETQEKASDKAPVILPTTIAGGMVVSNDTSYEPELKVLAGAGSPVSLITDAPQILIIHTHGSEAYTPDASDAYAPSDTFRTEDKNFSVIRVGDELTACLESFGLSVIHDREIYDSPSYTGSYARSGDAVKKYLEQYPSISVVLDVHRDAIGNGDVVYKTVAEANGEPCSQLMLLVGTGENGLEHPNWQKNLQFALYLQSVVVSRYPSLPRPIALKKERYNQQLSTGSLILEVGSSGNTLSEALNAVRLFANAVGPALAELAKG